MDRDFSANLLNAAKLSLIANQPAIASGTWAENKSEETSPGTQVEQLAAGVANTDPFVPGTAIINNSTADAAGSDTPAPALAAKTKLTTVPARNKKDGSGSALLAPLIAALAQPQWNPFFSAQAASDGSISAGAAPAIEAAPVLPLPQSEITTSASSRSQLLSQAVGTQTQPGISRLPLDASLTTKTKFLPQPRNENAEVSNTKQTRPMECNDVTPPTPTSTEAPQDVSSALPATDPLNRLTTISADLSASSICSPNPKTYPQTCTPDSLSLDTTEPLAPSVNSEAGPAKLLIAESSLPQTQVIMQAESPAQVSTSITTTASGNATTKLGVEISGSPAVKISFDSARPLHTATKPEAASPTAANFKSPIQIPDSLTLVKYSAQGHAPLPASAPSADSQPHTAGSRAEVSGPALSPGALQSSALKTGNFKLDSLNPVPSTTQGPRPEKSHAANSFSARPDSGKANAAKTAGNDSIVSQSSGPDPKTTSTLPLSTPAANTPQANSQSNSATNNTGPLIAVVQSATNTSAKTDSAAPQLKPEPVLDNVSRPEPVQAQVARIFHNLNQSEMHVGLRTQSFGAVDVRTTISEKQVEVALGSERGDLKGFIASEMPALQSNLQQHDLRLQTLRTIASTHTTSADVFSGGGGQPQNSPRHGTASRTALFQGHGAARGDEEDLPTPRAGLSVRI